jgi:transcriptional regulator with XRE-family HTH domain
MSDSLNTLFRVAATDLLTTLYARDSPWSAPWQVEEAIRVQLDKYEPRDAVAKKEFLSYLEAELSEKPEMVFSEWLRRRLRQKGWNQSEFARSIETNPSVVSKWVRGLQRPRPEQCARIANSLKEDLDTVMELAGHLPKRHRNSWEPFDFLMEVPVREEILQMLDMIPESVLFFVSAMLRGLIDGFTDGDLKDVLDARMNALQQVRPISKENSRSAEGDEK